MTKKKFQKISKICEKMMSPIKKNRPDCCKILKVIKSLTPQIRAIQKNLVKNEMELTRNSLSLENFITYFLQARIRSTKAQKKSSH
jgi:hypothetical protein